MSPAPVLPTPGEEPWGDKLNAAITSIESRVNTLESSSGTSATRMVPLIIFNGESSSGGYALNTDATPAELAPRPSVKIFDNLGLTSFQTLDIGTNNLVDHSGLVNGETHGWELGLANSVEAGEWYDNTVYLVKTGQGGSKVSEWNVGSTFWTKFLQRTRGARNALRSMNLIPVIYVWFGLGVNDAIQGTPEAQVTTGIKDMHNRIREELGFVPIFYVKAATSSPGVSFDDQIDLMAADDNMVIPIDTTGAATRDANHWNYAGNKTMASRLVAASKLFGQHEGYLMQQTAMMAGGAALTPPADLPSIVRSPATISFIEGSAGATFTVTLSAVPAANVIVDVAVSGGNCTRNPTTLTFTTSNWSTPQTVTVTSPNDGSASGNRSGTVTLSSPDVSSSTTVGVTVTDAGAGVGPPVNTVLPAISGTTTLTCSAGSWTQSPTSYAYQWKRDGTNISGETANTHTIIAADQGHGLTCTVTATNASGSTNATSTAFNVASGTPVTWGQFANTDSPSPGTIRCTTAATPAGAVATQTIDLSQPFDIEIAYSSGPLTTALLICIDDDSSANFTWDGSNTFIEGGYQFSDAHQSAVSGSSVSPTGQTLTYPCKIKMSKSGNDIVYRFSTGGAYGAVFYTRAGVLAGKTTGYIKALFAVPTINEEIKVSVL